MILGVSVWKLAYYEGMKSRIISHEYTGPSSRELLHHFDHRLAHHLSNENNVTLTKCEDDEPPTSILS